MGARPIAILDSLRLGPLDEDRPRRLFDGIVRGVGGYGNCVGVANVGGETVFDAAYRDNPLVNAMALGVLEAGQLVRALAPPAPATRSCSTAPLTGRDGIGGASVLASQDLDEESADEAPVGADRRSVHRQEAARVLARARRSAASSSRCRISARPGSRRRSPRWPRAARSASRSSSTRVPLREPGMQPFEIMISESQERMAAVVEPARLAEVRGRLRAPRAAVHGDRPRDRGRPPGRAVRRRDGRRPAGRRARRRAHATRSQPRRPELARGRAARRVATIAEPADAVRAAAAAARAAERLLEGLGLRAVRPARRLGHGACGPAATPRSCG